MKFLQRIAISLLTLTAFLTACGQAPNPTPPRVFKTLGNLEVTLDTAGDASAKIVNPQTRSSTPLPDNALSFTRKFSSSFDIETSNERYMSATFEVKNNSGKPINNLSLIAYNQPDQSIAGTAVKNLINFGGAAITDSSIAQGIYPAQSLKRVGIETVVDAENADFQGFTPSDAESIASTAKTNQIIRNEDTPLEYGFIARNSTNTRIIGDGETGSVTLTLRFERPTNPITTPYKFVMTFVIVEDSIPRVTRGINETTSEAETRAYLASATELMLIGPDTDVPNNTAIKTVRIENAKIGLSPTYLVKPALFMKDVQPKTINNDHDNTVSIKGIKFDPSTSFFIQSTKLEVLSQTETEALVTVPKGFIASKYGIMAANNKGERNTIYPALTINEGAPARDLDVRENYKSFLDGYVFDYETKLPIKGAKISIPGLETTSGDSGYFMLRGVPAGRHVVKIEKKGYGYNANTERYDTDADTHESLYRIANVPSNPNSTITLKLVMLEPKTNNVTMIGAEGGIHYATSDHTTGPFIKIPAGALDKSTPIQFTHLRDGTTLPELNDNGNYLAFAHLGPTGLVFKKPATLFLPLQKGIVLNNGESINILYFDTKTGTWVDDITGGKISKINGQQYLEYEINHFTWIGGGNPVPPTSFSGRTGTGGSNCSGSASPILDPTLPPPPPPCSESPEGEDQDCQPKAGVPTNKGISDENGNVKGSEPGSRQPKDVNITPLGRGNNVVPGKKTVQPNDTSIQKIPCAKVPADNVPSSNKPEATGDNPCSGSLTPQPKSGNPVQRFTTRASTGNLIVTSSSLSGFKTSVGNFGGAKVDPSSVTLSIGGKDYTRELDLKPSTSFYDGFDFAVKLTDPLKAQPNLEIKLAGTTKDGTPFETKTVAGVIAKLKAPKAIIPFIVPDNIPLTKPTPYTVEGLQGLLVVARASDAVNGFLNTQIPVTALDEKGQILSTYSSDTNLSLRNSVSNGDAKFVNGIALMPVKIPLDNAGKSTTLGHLFNLSSNGLRNSNSAQTRATANKTEDCGDAPAGAVGQPVSLDEPVTIYDTIASLPGINQLLDWMNKTKDLEFEIAGLKFTYGDFVTLGWGLIPLLGDATTLIDNAYQLLLGKGADPVEATLASVSFGFDASGNEVAGAAGSAMLFVFKISKAGKGIFKDWIAAAIKACTEKPLKCFELLKKEFSYLIDLFKNGGSVALRTAEEQISRISANLAGGLADVKQALGKLAEYPTLDALGNPITTERLLGVMDDVDNVPGFDRVTNKIATAGNAGNIRGAVGELERASSLKKLGATDIEFKGEITFTDSTGALVKSDIDIAYRNAEGNLVFEEIKSANISSIYFDPLSRDGPGNLRQAQNFAAAARASGAIPQWNVPNCSVISSASLVVLRSLGIEIFDANLGKC
jgi:hypothetical protein